MKILYLTVRERRPNRHQPDRKDQRLEKHPEHAGITYGDRLNLN